jgi:hypothetical protein
MSVVKAGPPVPMAGEGGTGLPVSEARGAERTQPTPQPVPDQASGLYWGGRRASNATDNTEVGFNLSRRT